MHNRALPLAAQGFARLCTLSMQNRANPQAAATDARSCTLPEPAAPFRTLPSMQPLTFARGDEPPAAQRSRSEVRIASRCPVTVTAATATSATTSTRVPARSPAARSTTAAASASSVASTATNAR